MRRNLIPILVLICAGVIAPAGEEPASPPTPSLASDANAEAAETLSPEAAAVERDRFVKEVLQQIAGREKEPAENVFKNIEILKGVPAGRLPRIMDTGFGRSLGVSCTHCHVAGLWEKDDKPAKRIAREMSTMTKAIGSEYLAKIEGLRSERPVVNCTTCHRGQLKPALDLPASPGIR